MWREREGGLGENVVLKLSEALSGHHHQVYFDNYFTTIPLVQKLLARDTHACGTVRSNRKQYPKEICEEAKRGEFLLRQSGSIVAVAWKDNKVVNVLSSLASVDDTATVHITQKDGSSLSVPCPRSVALYNEFMGGVDHGDHLRGSYKICLKCRIRLCFLRFSGISYTQSLMFERTLWTTRHSVWSWRNN